MLEVEQLPMKPEYFVNSEVDDNHEYITITAKDLSRVLSIEDLENYFEMPGELV